MSQETVRLYLTSATVAGKLRKFYFLAVYYTTSNGISFSAIFRRTHANEIFCFMTIDYTTQGNFPFSTPKEKIRFGCTHALGPARV